MVVDSEVTGILECVIYPLSPGTIFMVIALEAVELRSANSLYQESANFFSVKGYMVNILGFAYAVFVANTQLSIGSM